MSQAKTLRRKHKKAPSEVQRGFQFSGAEGRRRVPPQKDSIPKARLPAFEEPDPFAVTINGQRLSDYLKDMGQAWVVSLVELLYEIDWRMFFPSYSPTGRPPIHPRIMMGLLTYGALIGRTSLRELETLASLDLGAWFVCGGLQPDHSTVGKFLQRHCDILTEDFFAGLTVHLVSRLKLSPGVAAIDGTVVAAVSSRLNTLKLEAAREAAKEAAAQVSALAKSKVPEDATRTAPPAPTLPEIAPPADDGSTAPSQPSAQPPSSSPTPASEPPTQRRSQRRRRVPPRQPRCYVPQRHGSPGLGIPNERPWFQASSML
ncbi:MAG: transposase [Myxococcales bacterium]